MDYPAGIGGYFPFLTPPHIHTLPQVAWQFLPLEILLCSHVTCFGQWNMGKSGGVPVLRLPLTRQHSSLLLISLMVVPHQFSDSRRMKDMWNRATLVNQQTNEHDNTCFLLHAAEILGGLLYNVCVVIVD